MRHRVDVARHDRPLPPVRGLGALRSAEPPRLLAVGWATVDLERTFADLGIEAPAER